MAASTKKTVPGKTKLRLHSAVLHYFDAVHRAGSVREAARRLNVASSAVNRQILYLEEELGTPLFMRLSSGMRLTSAGELLAHHVQLVLRDAEEVSSRLDQLRGLHAGHVEVATVEGLCAFILPEAIGLLARRHPRITVGVQVLDTRDIPGAIARGDAHMGLAFEVSKQPDIRQLHVAPFVLGAIVRPDSPLAVRRVSALSDYFDMPVILPKSNFANRAQLDALLPHAIRQECRRYDVGSIELMKQLVLRNAGVAFMTQVGIEPELRAGTLQHIPIDHHRKRVVSNLGLYAHATAPLPVAADALARHLIGVMGAGGVPTP
ncbi:LysR family transcriptional regulator [Gluconacetobacter tumulicola]|uniref:LysR family transcriptional regulator n=2 Tax=Gluconacetobacter tumulicola TaxID=1017177 RepID=A0A7W4P7V8_9PROT|nr:LysR family transcriptional regulator [Gluconacetobacter tumulicola]